jgi:NAD-dependent deacetylase
MMTDETDLVRRKLNEARRIAVLTGAGISAESGVPTFRGGGGAAVWRGMPFEQLSSAEMVARDLQLVWEWFDYRREVVGKCEPNAGHLALARWQKEGDFDSFTLITQNIDGLHAAAGSIDVLELHGNIWRARCVRCVARRDLRDIAPQERPPVCLKCNGEMRPDVVLFGEMLPIEVLERSQTSAEQCDVCLVIGTSALVYPAAALPEIARESGAFVVEINPEQTPLSSLCHVTLSGRAGEMLPMLLSENSTRL